MILNEHFYNTIQHQGIVTIITWENNNVHASNTWNSYLRIVENNIILIPAAAMIQTEKNIRINPNVKLILGSHEVMGYKYMGTGFLLTGTAQFLTEGEYYTMMLNEFSFLTRVLAITVQTCKQTL